MESVDASVRIEEVPIELTIDQLIDPIVNIVRHYRNRELERRALFFAWVANIFKPIAAIEVSKILGFEYRRVDSLFRSLNQSGVLVDVSLGGENYRIVPGTIPLYIGKDVINGRKLTGRPPKMFVFSERQSFDFDSFVKSFNSDSSRIWDHVISKVVKLAESVDPAYQGALVADGLFIAERIGPIFKYLREEGILIYERSGSRTDVKVKLKGHLATYKVPKAEPFTRLM